MGKHGRDCVIDIDMGPISDEMDEFQAKFEKTREIQHLQQLQQSQSPRTLCRKMRRSTTRSDRVIALIWFCLMTATLFGLSFGLIHIGNGVMTLKAAHSITVEQCRIASYSQTECVEGSRYSYSVN